MSDSGRILLDGDVIRYQSAIYGSWGLNLAAVRIIGEFTNQNGPFLDDYFVCFATGLGEWLEASFYAEGREEFLRALEGKLAVRLELGLCHSADFASRVLWPASLAGEPMFRFDEMPTDGLLPALGIPRNRQTFSPRVAAVLASDGTSGANALQPQDKDS
jgi:hypothetical protein